MTEKMKRELEMMAKQGCLHGYAKDLYIDMLLDEYAEELNDFAEACASANQERQVAEMTVKNLIALLEAMPQDLEVVYETGRATHDVVEANVVEERLNGKTKTYVELW